MVQILEGNLSHQICLCVHNAAAGLIIPRLTSTKISPSLNCIPLPIFYVLHVTAVLFISTGTSVRPSAAPPSVRPRPSVRPSGVYAARTPPCPAHATAGAGAAAPAAPAAALHLNEGSKKRKKLFFRRLSYLEQTRAHGRTDARTWEAPHRDIGGHRTNARMQIGHERVVEVANGTLEWGEF